MAPFENTDLAQQIASLINPQIGRIEKKVDDIERKVDDLQKEYNLAYDRLRKEVATGFVSRDVLTPELAALKLSMQNIEKSFSKDIDSLRRELTKDMDTMVRQRDAAILTLSNRLEALEKSGEKRWGKWGIVAGITGAVVAAFELIATHLNFH